MGLLSKKTIRTLAIIFISLFLICAITSIILAGIDYRYAGPDWKVNYPYYAVPGLQIACIIYSFVIVIFGYIAFIKPNIGCTVAYSVFLMLSILFNIAIAILCLIAGSVGWVNTYFGCNGKFDGILGIWQGIDIYLQQVDQNLCSSQCPCFFSNTTAFTTNSAVAPFFDRWDKTSLTAGNLAFQNCSAAVQSKTFVTANQMDSFFDPDKTFDPYNFMDYMNRIENEFQCTGWCNVTYYNSNYQQNMVMYKYLFTDVNRGPPLNIGCLNQIIQWLPGYLKAFGSVTMVLAGFQIIVFALAICQCWAREKDHEHQIPHHHDDDRK